MGEELVNSLNPHKVFSFNIFGYEVPVTDTIIIMWIVMAIIIIAAFILTRNLQTVPKGKQNLVESIVDMINSLSRNNIGHYGRHFAPYLGTILIFLIFSNIISIFNIIPDGEQLYKLTHIEFFEQYWPRLAMRPPTKDINTTAAMAIISIIVVLFAGIRFKKFKGWMKSFIEPIPLVLPFKIIDYFIRPLSLCFRLFGNILGAFIVMELLYAVLPVIIPAAVSIYFDLFDGMLQAYIFVFLTSLYIAEAVE